jgi:altronate hydrolase
VSESPIVVLHADDNIAIAKQLIPEGVNLSAGNGAFCTKDRIDFGHKVAQVDIASGQPIRKFGQIIGFATERIEAGQWVHVHNVTPGELSLDYAFSSEIPPDPDPIIGRTFEGIKRSNGKTATRNYIGILSTVNCSATTSKYVAANFDDSILDQFPNVDGVVALTHKGGCAFDYDGDEHRQLALTMAGFAKHPNIAAYVILGLGCETAQASFLADKHGLVQLHLPDKLNDDEQPLIINIQDVGGVQIGRAHV